MHDREARTVGGEVGLDLGAAALEDGELALERGGRTAQASDVGAERALAGARLVGLPAQGARRHVAGGRDRARQHEREHGESERGAAHGDRRT